jgi:hypothetical protein
VVKRLVSVALVVLGVGLVLFGLLFLLGAAGRIHRYVVAAASMALGALLIGLGIRFFRQADKVLPEQLRAEIFALAGRLNGEISEDDLHAALGRRLPQAREEILHLCRQGDCRQQRKGGDLYYVFEGLMPRLTIRRCEYCDAEIPLNQELSTCPKCGGTIKTGVERVSLSKGDAYSMDE